MERTRSFAILFGLLLLAAGACLLLWAPWGRGPEAAPDLRAAAGGPEGADPLAGGLPPPPAAATAPARRPAGGGSAAPGGGIVAGRVFSLADGSPVPDVEVLAAREVPATAGLEELFTRMIQKGLWSAAARRVEPEVVGRATSGGDGTFLLAGLPAGRIWLALGEGFHYVHRFPGVRLGPGERRDGVELAAAEGGLVRGRVLDAGGRPVAGATLDLRPGFNSFLGHFLGTGYRWGLARSDGEGRFAFSGVPPGEEYVLSAFGPNLPLRVEMDLAVARRQAVEVVLQGERPAALAGVVQDPEGRPVAGARVAVALLDVHKVLFSAEACPPATTGPDGAFRLGNLPPGEVALAAVAEGEAVSEPEEVVLAAGEELGGLVLKVGGGGEVAGVVVDPGGGPVAGAVVEALSNAMEGSLDLRQLLTHRPVSAATGEDGAFRLGGLLGQRVFLRANRAGYAETMGTRVRVGDQAVRITLRPEAAVAGIVLDKAASAPLKGFLVELRGVPYFRQGRYQWEVAAEDGRFRLDGVPAGTARLRFLAEGYVPETVAVEVAPGEGAKGVIVLMAREAAVAGRVVDAGGRPVPGAAVIAFRGGEREFPGPPGFFGAGGGEELGLPASLPRPRGGRPQGPPQDNPFEAFLGAGGPGRAQSGPDGSFRVGGLVAGKWRLLASHPDHARGEPVEVETSAERPATGITLELARGGAIAGFVTGLDGRPVARAVVVAASLQAVVRSATTDARGFYRIDHLVPGSYFVFKSRLQGRTTRNLAADLLGNLRLKTVSVRGEEEVRFDITDQVEGGVLVTGVVREGGRPVPDAVVTALTTAGDGPLGIGVRSTVSDREGGYSLPSLLPGAYVFQVVAMRKRPSTIPVEIPAGASRQRRDLDLPTSRVRGIVLGADGQPLKGARVRAVPREQAGEGLLALFVAQGAWRASSDQEGKFTLNRIPPGTYRLEAEPPRDRRDQGKAVLEGVIVDGAADLEGLTLSLPPAAVLRGTVRDGTGAPVVGAAVEAVAGEAGPEVPEALRALSRIRAPRSRTDGQGSFALEGLEPGSWTVRAEKEDYAPALVEGLLLAQGQELQVALTLARGGTVRVRVVNSSGSPLPRATVTVLDGEGRPVAAQVSAAQILRRLVQGREGEEGTHTFRDVKPGTYTVVVRGPSGGEERRPLEVREGETADFTLELKE